MTETAEIHEINKLSPKQLEVLPMLAAGMSYKDAAERVEISYGTVRNWASQNPHFKAELKARQRTLYVESHSRLQALAHEATQALYDVLTDPKAPARDRISAAKTVLAHVHDKNTNHTIRSSDDAAAMIAKILNESELS